MNVCVMRTASNYRVATRARALSIYSQSVSSSNYRSNTGQATNDKKAHVFIGHYNILLLCVFSPMTVAEAAFSWRDILRLQRGVDANMELSCSECKRARCSREWNIRFLLSYPRPCLGIGFAECDTQFTPCRALVLQCKCRLVQGNWIERRAL